MTVTKALLDGVSFVRVECEHSAEQVVGGRLEVREELVPWLTGPLGQVLDVLECILVSNVFLIFLGRCAQD